MKLNFLVLLSVIAFSNAALHDSHKRQHRRNIGRTVLRCPGDSSRICTGFGEVSVDGINRQINKELSASYQYQAMANYFARDDVALKGVSKFFQKAANEERDHANLFIDYVTKRGGRVELDKIEKPKTSEWSDAVGAFRDALDLEKQVTDAILNVHWEAEHDPHLQDFLEAHFLTEQVDSMKQIGEYISQLERLGAGVGVHIFDKELQ